jgi:hypothetical protein
MKKQFILSVVISLTFLSLGFLLLYYDLIGYGLSIFVFLPFILGYLLGKSVIKRASLIGLIFSLVVFFLLLIAGDLEGMGCILMAMPLVIISALIGILIKNAISKNKKENEPDNLIKKSILPLFIFLGVSFGEKQLTINNKEIISVTSEIVLPYSTLEVYEAIKSFDTLIADKPFLMKLDLPIPNKCILEKEEVGGLRTCYFSGGTITERITELEKAKVLRMDVIDYKLTGRKWLGFKEAIYYFNKLGQDSCKLTRITTYTSELSPRFYWQPLEKIGISQEHDYVFASLINNLKTKYGR